MESLEQFKQRLHKQGIAMREMKFFWMTKKTKVKKVTT